MGHCQLTCPSEGSPNGPAGGRPGASDIYRCENAATYPCDSHVEMTSTSEVCQDVGLAGG